METISPLQQQFPLSPRKFWKKMLPKLFGFAFIPIIFLGIISPFFFLSEGSQKMDIGVTLAFAVIGGLILYLILILPYAWYVKTYIKRYYYTGEENFITIKKGVFAPGEIHVHWQKIQDVYVDQDIIDRVMGLYDVHIASATVTSGIEAHIDGVDHAAAEGLKTFLLGKVSTAGKGRTQNIATEQASSVSQSPQSNSSTIKLSEPISSNTYPLTDKWTIITLLSRLVGSFAFPAFLILILFGKTREILIVDYWIYLVLGWLAFGILTMIVRTVIFFLWKGNYAFDFTPEHIYHREGVISLSEKHMPYSSVQNVTVKQSIVERIFGLARVFIENASQQPVTIGRHGKRIIGFAGIAIHGLSLADANKITDILKTTVLGRNTSHYGL